VSGGGVASLVISPIEFNPIHALAVVLEALRAHDQDVVVQRDGRAVTARLRRDVRRVQLQEQALQQAEQMFRTEPRPSSLTTEADVSTNPRPTNPRPTNPRPSMPHAQGGAKSWSKKKPRGLDGGLSNAM
jgi:hypothetical protein